MRIRNWLALALGLGLIGNSPADSGKNAALKPAVDTARMEALIGQLGSAKYEERKRARAELEAIGLAALPALRKAVNHADIETRRRCEDIVRLLEEKVQTAAMLAPKRVRLNLKDVPVMDAVAELAKRSGYAIEVMGDRTGLANRKVTLDTGETTFWEAFDQLCLKAGLVESQPAVVQQQPGNPFQQIPLRQVPPIKLRPLLPKIPAPGGILPIPPAPPANLPLFQGVQQQGAQGFPGKPGAPGQGQPGGQAQPGRIVLPIIPMPGAPRQGQPGQAGQAQPGRIVLPIQMQPGQGMPGQPFGGPFNRLPGITSNPGTLTVTDGKAKELPTSYAGAVRIRLLGSSLQGTDALLTLDVAAEPRLQDFRILGAPRIDKAIDDQGQALMMAMEPGNPNPFNPGFPPGGNVVFLGANPFQQTPQRQVPVRLKLGEKQAKTLKEISGSISAEALTQTEALITVVNVLKSAGQTVKGKNGGAIQVHAIDKQANGDYQVKVTLENMPDQNAFGGNGAVQINGGAVIIRQIQINNGNVVIGGMGLPGNGNNHPKLLDAKGQAYQFAGATNSTFNLANGQSTVTATLVYRPQAGQGEPSQLVQYGQRKISFQVPFTLRNVPLP